MYQDNIFTDIIHGSANCDKIYEDTALIAFKDINPIADIHILIAPKKKVVDFSDFISSSTKEEIADFFTSVNKVADKLNLGKNFKLIMNTGYEAGQRVFHFHIHMISGKNLKEHD